MGAHDEVPSLKFVVSLVGNISVCDDFGQAVPAEAEAAIIEAHLDQVMDELCNLGAVDPGINLSGNTVEFTVLVEAMNPLGGVSQASGLLRTAIHAAEGGTPDWPAANDKRAWAVSLVSVRSDQVTADDEVLVPA